MTSFTKKSIGNSMPVRKACLELTGILLSFFSASYCSFAKDVIPEKTLEIKNIDFSQNKNADFKTVSIPHSMNANNGTGGIPLIRGDGYYKYEIDLQKTDLQKDYIIQFEQVAQVAEIFLNDTLLHKNYCGYTPFAVKLTGLKEGKNTILIHTNNRRDSKIIPSVGDFNFYNGILGKAFLLSGNLYFDPQVYGIDKAHIIPISIAKDEITFGVASSIFSKDMNGVASVNVKLLNAEGESILSETIPFALKQGSNEFRKNFTFKNPILWQAKENPYLYTVDIQLVYDKKICDELKIPYGFREIQMPYSAKDNLLRLNGQPVRLRGVCLHQDFPNAAAAMTDEQRAVDRAIIQEIGCNWIRCAHYPHNVNEFAAYDKMGIMCQTEIPWVDYYDGSPEFAEHVTQFMHDMINNLYNHPSIILWGISNEIWFSQHSDNVVNLHNKTYMLGRRLDPYRPVGFVSREQEVNRASSNGLIADWYGNNAYPGWYSRNNFTKDLDAVSASQCIAKFYLHGITEYGYGANPNHHNSDFMTMHNGGRNNKTGTSGGSGGAIHPEEYQTFGHINSWNYINATDIGKRMTFTSIWNLFDFAVSGRNEGGTPGINDKGLVTRDRKTKKDAFYLYKCAWNPEPEVHIISSRWKERDTKDITITVLSNCDKVALYQNDELVQTLEKSTDPKNGVVWSFNPVLFQKETDTFRAVGFKNDKIVKENTATFSTTNK